VDRAAAKVEESARLVRWLLSDHGSEGAEIIPPRDGFGEKDGRDEPVVFVLAKRLQILQEQRACRSVLKPFFFRQGRYISAVVLLAEVVPALDGAVQSFLVFSVSHFFERLNQDTV
jgi:hypothetical protein